MPDITLLSRGIVAFVLGSAAVGKFADFGGFVDVLRREGISSEWAPPVARFVLALEVVLAPLILLGVGLPWSAVATAALLVLFTVVVARHAMIRPKEDCGCCGTKYRPVLAWQGVLRNVALLGLTAIGVSGDSRYSGIAMPGTFAICAMAALLPTLQLLWVYVVARHRVNSTA